MIRAFARTGDGRMRVRARTCNTDALFPSQLEVLKRGMVEMHESAVLLRARVTSLRDAIPRLAAAAASADAGADAGAPAGRGGAGGAGWGEVERRVGEVWEGLEAVLEAEARCRRKGLAFAIPLAPGSASGSPAAAMSPITPVRPSPRGALPPRPAPSASPSAAAADGPGPADADGGGGCGAGRGVRVELWGGEAGREAAGGEAVWDGEGDRDGGGAAARMGGVGVDDDSIGHMRLQGQVCVRLRATARPVHVRI
jgi:hypothetical protein